MPNQDSNSDSEDEDGQDKDGSNGEDEGTITDLTETSTSKAQKHVTQKTASQGPPKRRKFPAMDVTRMANQGKPGQKKGKLTVAEKEKEEKAKDEDYEPPSKSRIQSLLGGGKDDSSSSSEGDDDSSSSSEGEEDELLHASASTMASQSTTAALQSTTTASQSTTAAPQPPSQVPVRGPTPPPLPSSYQQRDGAIATALAEADNPLLPLPIPASALKSPPKARSALGAKRHLQLTSPSNHGTGNPYPTGTRAVAPTTDAEAIANARNTGVVTADQASVMSLELPE